MMDHDLYRSQLLADPRNPDAQMREHRETCPECARFSERLLSFEGRLERALRIEIPSRENVVLLAASRTPKRGPLRWMAMAAGVLIGAIVAGAVWLALPERSLAAAVVAHMAGEPDAWRSVAAVPDPELETVLRESKLRLTAQTGTVTYASSCFFRGHHVPHLVVQTKSGPVTVMVLVHESVHHARQFDEQGYSGTIVPVPGHGSLAVLMRDPGADTQEVQQIAARVRDSIVWTP
jgi:Protein of unknown function (DUF3379)